MVTAVRWVVVFLLGIHGMTHFLGAAAGFGWAEVRSLTQPVGASDAVLWLVAGVLVVAAAVMIAAGGPSWWWAVGLAAALTSQAAILSSWQDAKAGTAVNAVLLLAAGYGFLSLGPHSFEQEWAERARGALSEPDSGTREVLMEADLYGLPEPVARYIRRSGAVGQPKVRNFYATVHGRIRSGPNDPWMVFDARQLNTYGPLPKRLFYLNASMRGIPVTVFHVLDDGGASMRGKAVSLVPVVKADGPIMDRGETVTFFNDLVVFAPAALVDAPVEWRVLGEDRVRARYTRADETITADLLFGPDGDLVDFVSDDRSRASSGGRSFTELRWNTPINDYAFIRGRRIPVAGDGKWYAPPPEGQFTYVAFHVDDIVYNVNRTSIDRGRAPLPAPHHWKDRTDLPAA